jgi:predicted oxidoreductase (fatty acid repression mutant protein)
MEYRDALTKRRSVYALKAVSPVSDEVLIKRIKEVVNEAPSAFGAQAPRIVIALGDKHKKVWEITKDTLRKIVPANKFSGTEAKLNMFEAGYGTILLYTDDAVTEKLKKDYPLYAKPQDQWAEHNIGILIAQLWSLFVDLGLAANLQHYNPLIDEAVAKEFKVPSSWRLAGEMVFGSEVAKPGEKDYTPIDERVLIEK